MFFRLVGGQLRISSHATGEFLQGEIASTALNNGELTVNLCWLARYDGRAFWRMSSDSRFPNLEGILKLSGFEMYFINGSVFLRSEKELVFFISSGDERILDKKNIVS